MTTGTLPCVMRRRLSLMVLFMAAAASVATSPPQPSGLVGDPVDGPAFTLDEQNPVQVFSVVVVPNGPATTGGVERGTVWADIRFKGAAGADASEIEVECQRPNDEQDQPPTETRYRVGAVQELAVSEGYEAFSDCADHETFCGEDLLLRFQHNGGGPVQVEWSVWGVLVLYEASKYPAAAKIDVTITPAGDG